MEVRPEVKVRHIFSALRFDFNSGVLQTPHYHRRIDCRSSMGQRLPLDRLGLKLGGQQPGRMPTVLLQRT